MQCTSCNKGSSCNKLCPLSFGLALGLVGFFGVMLETWWVMNHGLSPFMAAMHLPAQTLHSGFMHALSVLAKGFVFGFFVALLYDLISCCFSCLRSKKQCACTCKTQDKK